MSTTSTKSVDTFRSWSQKSFSFDLGPDWPGAPNKMADLCVPTSCGQSQPTFVRDLAKIVRVLCQSSDGVRYNNVHTETESFYAVTV